MSDSTAIDLLFLELEEILESNELVGPEYETVFSSLDRTNFLREVFWKAERQKLTGEFISKRKDLWKKTLSWLSSIWFEKPELRSYVSFAVEEYIREISYEDAVQTNVFELLESFAKTGSFSDGVVKMIYGVFGSYGDPRFKEGAGSVLIRAADESSVKRAFELVCNRHASHEWALNLGVHFKARLDSETIERCLFRDLSDNNGNISRDQLAYAFETFTSDPLTARGRIFLESLQNGSGLFEAKSAVYNFSPAAW